MTAAADIIGRLERLPPSRAMWTLVALISLGGCFEFYDLMMTAYISPALVRAGVFHTGRAGLFGASDQASFAAATFLGLFIGTIAVSRLADRFGRRAIFTLSLLWYTAAAVAMAAQSDAIGIDAWRLVGGVGIGVELVTIDAYIAELVPRGVRGRAFAINQSIQFLAVPAVALAAWRLSPLSIVGIAGWRWVILIGAAAAVVVWFIRARLPESPRWLAEHGRLAEADKVVSRLEAGSAAAIGPPASQPQPQAAGGHARLSEIFARPLLGRTILLVVLNAFQAVGFYGFTNWAPAFIASRGAGFAQSLQYGFVIAVAYPFGPLVWSTIAERFERKWLVVAAAAGTGLLGLVFATQRSPLALIALGVAINFSNNLLSFSYHAYQAELFPTRVRAAAVGFVYSWSRLSTVASSYAIGWLLEVAGAPGAFGFIAGAMLVVVVAVGAFGPPTRGRTLEEIAP